MIRCWPIVHHWFRHAPHWLPHLARGVFIAGGLACVVVPPALVAVLPSPVVPPAEATGPDFVPAPIPPEEDAPIAPHRPTAPIPDDASGALRPGDGEPTPDTAASGVRLRESAHPIPAPDGTALLPAALALIVIMRAKRGVYARART